MRRTALLLMCLALGACAKKEQAAAPPNEVTAERGPITAVVRATPGTGRVGTLFAVVVEAEAEAGITLELPEIGETLGPFEVTELSIDPDVPTETGRRWRMTAFVQTFEAGTIDVPELEIAIVDAREDPPVESVMAIGPLDIEVSSVLDAEGNTEELRDIRGGVDLSAPIPLWWWFAGGGAVLLVLAGAVLLVLLGRRAIAPPPPVPAHVWALGQLDFLQRDDLVAKGDFDGFFVRLTGIVRGYIERRFGVAAPELTTEEFIRRVPRLDAFPTEHVPMLSEFLRAADMVKFARVVPGRAESEVALETARDFVVTTRILSEASGVAAA